MKRASTTLALLAFVASGCAVKTYNTISPESAERAEVPVYHWSHKDEYLYFPVHIDEIDETVMARFEPQRFRSTINSRLARRMAGKRLLVKLWGHKIKWGPQGRRYRVGAKS